MINRYFSSGWVTVATFILATVPAVASSGILPEVAELTATLAADRSSASVNFRIEGGVTEDALERIHSGITVTLKYRLRMMADRQFPWLPWDEVARTRVLATVTYDSLVGVYSLTRTFNVKVRHKRDKQPPVVETRVTSSVDEMRLWMTQFEDVALYEPGFPYGNRPLRIKLDSDLGRRYIWFVLPGRLDAHAQFDLVE